MFWLSSRYYSPELCRWISPDSVDYLDPESINGLNLYCYCMNNPVMYVDPSGHSTLLVLGIIAASLVVGGAIYGGVSALMAGGIIYGARTVLGSIMVTYGASITANMLEVAVTQGKNSYYDGDSFWSGANDITNAMFANSSRILAGNLALDGLSIMGTRMFSKAWTLAGFFGQVNATAQYWKYSKAMSIVSSTFWKSKANPLALIVGYGLTGYQLFNLERAIFTTPDFENNPWILYWREYVERNY